jgi:DNA-binding protein HU-beta
LLLKKELKKTGRNISKNTTIKIPAHSIPAFKPAKVFVSDVKNNN